MEKETNKPKPTKAMKKYWAELQEEQNERYAEQNKRNKLSNELQALIEQIGTATVGYGLALKVLVEKRERIEKEIAGIPQPAHFDTGIQFKKRYGIDPWQLNFTEPPVEEDIKNSAEDDVDD